jgi:nitrous oxidase accessory protein NosD
VNQSTTDDNNGSGIAIRDTVSNIFIRNVYITATAANGIYTQGTITNLNVIDCETNATGKRGVHISANGAKILGGYFHDTLDHDGIQFGDTASNCLVIGAYCYNNAFKGIEVQVGSTNVSVIGCHVYDNGDVGVAFQQGANNCKVVDCEVYGNNSHGIHIDLTASNPSQYALVQGNTVINNGDALGESGIVIDNSSYARVIGNHVAGNQRHNILLTTATFCTVMGNVCMNGSATTGTTTGEGIALEGNSLNNIVSGNIGTDNQVTKTQRYGVSVTAGSNNNIITSNQLSGNLTGSLSDSGTSTSVNNHRD